MTKKIQIVVVPIMILLSINLDLIGQVMAVSLKSNKNKVEVILRECIADSDSIKANSSYRMISYHYNLISSCYANLNKMDSSKYFLILSKSYDTEWFCEFTSMNVHRTSPHTQDPRFSYFTDALDSVFLDSLLQDCPKTSFVEKKEIYSNKLFQLISDKDQLYRKQIGSNILDSNDTLWVKQNKLDHNNRSLLDSLYMTEKMKIFIDPMHAKVIWRVLHHSTDCDWNERWIKVIFEAIHHNKTNFGFISQTLERFYNPTDGYCTKQRQSNVNIIEELKKLYPAEMKRIKMKANH